MGRPKQYDAKRICTALRIEPDLHARLRDEAAARDVSVNWLMERILREGIEALRPVDDRPLLRARKGPTR